MNRTTRMQSLVLASAMVCLSLMGALAYTSNAEAKNPVIGTVTYLRGEVFRSSQNSSNWRPLKVEMKLREGDRLQTKKSARVEATLSDGSVVRLGQSTQLSLKKVVTNDKGQRKSVKAKLFFGKIWAGVKKAVGAETELQ